MPLASVDRSVDPLNPANLYEDSALENVAEALNRLFLEVLIGGGAMAIAVTSVAPLERLKLLLQTGTTTQLAPRQSVLHILSRMKEGGWRALFRGNGANLLRILPDTSFKFIANDQFKIMFSPIDGGNPGRREKLAAASVSACLKTALFYPLDLARVRITADITSHDRRAYPSISSCISSTASREGIRGLYRGMGASLVHTVPYMSMSLVVYDELKAKLPSDPKSRANVSYPFLKMACASTAVASAQVLAYPLDTLRRRLQVSWAKGRPPGSNSYRGALHCLVEILSREGVAGLYRGCLVGTIKAVPAAAVQFVAFDMIKSGVTKLDPRVAVQSPL